MNRVFKIISTIPTTAVLVTGSALAHPGHIEASGNHSHWLALAAIGVAVAVLIAKVLHSIRLKRRQKAEG